MLTMIKIQYLDETATLVVDLSRANAPLVVDGKVTQYQVADARHRYSLAVALACSIVWPDADWPAVPTIGSVPDGWSDGSDAWSDLAYEAFDSTDLVLCESADGWSLHAPGSTDDDIAGGAAPALACGSGHPSASDYERAFRSLCRA